jgi:uncharacterized SAM-binding protein YcdF (DUF218 family)
MNSAPAQPVQASLSTTVRRVPLWTIKRAIFVVLLLALLLFARFAGSLLVRDRPEKSDVIVILAGDSQDERYRRGMELLRAGYARHLLLDASSDSHYFGHTPAEYAEAFLQQDAKNKDMSSQVSVCAFELDSTLTETGYVGKCLEPFHPANVLLVTSDWHTQRALSIFRHRLPQYHWSVAAAKDPRLFGVRWWHRREWAKITFNEWLKVVWWNGIDRWR